MNGDIRRGAWRLSRLHAKRRNTLCFEEIHTYKIAVIHKHLNEIYRRQIRPCVVAWPNGIKIGTRWAVDATHQRRCHFRHSRGAVTGRV